MLTINVVTLFPEVFDASLRVSILGRAATQGLVRYRVVQLREYTHDRHKTVDDYPYGGGAGMVLKPEPFFEAVGDLRAGPPIVLLSARGRPLTHRDAVRFAVGAELTLLCGHYKDVDQRVADGLGAEELSVGDFVLSGGEPAALCVLDAVVRLLPGALGDHESAATDWHYDGLLAPDVELYVLKSNIRASARAEADLVMVRAREFDKGPHQAFEGGVASSRGG